MTGQTDKWKIYANSFKSNATLAQNVEEKQIEEVEDEN